MKKLTLILSMLIALVGLNANAAIYLVGDGPLGGWAYNGGNEMTAQGNGLYTYNMTIAADAETATVYFVFADNRGTSWDDFNGNYRIGPTTGNQRVYPETWVTTQKAGGDKGAYYFAGTKGETYTVTYDEVNNQFKVEGYVEPILVDTWTVAGSNANLFGTTWDTHNTANDMVLVNGLYTWSKENVELTTAGFSFKVAFNHEWAEAYPADDYYQAIDKHGYYDVVITFNEDTKDVNCTATLVEEIEDPIIVDHTYTVAGFPVLFGSEWDETDEANNMTLVNGLYTWTKENVALPAGNIEFKVVQDHNWDIAWPSSNWVANIEQNGNYNVVITFNEDTKDITFNATLVEEIEDFYTVAGAPAAVFGEEWAAGYAANNMTLAEGVYTWTKDSVELAANAFIEFKVVKNANWNTCWPTNNYEYTCPEAGTYNLVITFNPENDEVTFTATKLGGEEPPVEMVYTVAGPAAVFGSEWDATDTNNDMVLNAETGLHTWSKDTVALTESFGFKVVGNHDWANEWPQGFDNNWIVNITEAGDYSLVITFNAETGDINCVATKLGGEEPPVEMVYTVAGPAAVFGSEWDATDTNNDMVLDAETGLYTWTADSVALTGNFGFKVVGNHDWANEWPQGFDNNWIVNITEAGDYNLVITFNAETGEINCTATKVGGGEEPPVDMVYTVAGPAAVFGSEWDATDTNNDMVLDAETGLYTWTADSVALTGSFGFKVVGNHDWANEWPQGYDNNWIVNITEAGDYNLVITFNAETGEINCVATKIGGGEQPEMVYTVAGPAAVFGTEWDATDTNNDMVLDAETGLYTWSKNNVALTESFGFKVVGNHDWANEWPQGYENNWIVNIEEAGNYNLFITFNPETGEINCTATKVEAGLRGDVNGDDAVNISDVTALINYLLSKNPAGVNLDNADCDLNESVSISDVTSLINYLLAKHW